MDCEGCEYLLDYDALESTQFMGEVHLPDRFAQVQGEDFAERLQLVGDAAPKSPEVVWKHLCAHGRFAIHGCGTLRDWLVANSAGELKSSEPSLR